MYTNFFYTLRREGIPVSITEWLTLMEALSVGLADSSLSGFYYLARAILVKSESHFDQYDLAFQKYFQGIETPAQLLDQVSKWMENPLPPKMFSEEERNELLKKLGLPDWESLKAALEERLRTQDGAHHGGGNWIGTGGTSAFGHSGFHPGGVRIGGESYGQSAVKVASERNYRDYRSDETLGVRQFEVALRKLRQFSTRLDGLKDQLDLDDTIDETCKNAGRLKLVWTRPRKNSVKVIVLMDVGGSMTPYANICSQLFSAVHKSSHFKDLKFYYFHNCIYDLLYLDASNNPRKAVKTEDILSSLSSDYRVVIIGDAAMAPSELMMSDGNIYWGLGNEEPGITWLQRIAKKFPYNVWLNPLPEKYWDRVHGYQTLKIVRDIFPMFELTLEGLDWAIKKLMVRK
ncbi:VWA domain-containing protein [Desulfosporosinus sp. BICA1-9]|uniref:vWA domain-containing protein n=1 Tax=Desulfosporosinus sp. BICA1-9 TaxID=1531958 RepID=UPI00054B8925|nr:VWA domain-containing protein [Desulfosporosinus sp. BICA1-9]KJS45962.1 MAG: VWA containing CoxE family protein [Peptococcaceae bacterium BRH_c23]KJS89434.1 MAG: VWA containing CoxE family protein [Desulfosporosinus sp. BICA1-9]HBW37071.1 VWA domain-containing protein [Desulfosporosinus sp.]